jgi:hypothetical protein
VNSEELELSLRSEFENYLKRVLADVRQDVSEFQRKLEAEFEKHKSQVDEAFRDLTARFESNAEFDEAFTESVIEHLRLARDEGATITAAAISEAEKLNMATAEPVDFDKLRDAVDDISRKTSQSEILKALIGHAANFTPRGAFFIVKNEHLVGWKVFGSDALDEDAVRNVHFPLSADTILSQGISAMKTVDNSGGGRPDDQMFLGPLGFGSPDRMYAVPLTARGRGVAVLYADYGTEGVALNLEALETLVRVAGLTVELVAASSQQPAPAPKPAPAVTAQPPAAEQPAFTPGPPPAVFEKAPEQTEVVHETFEAAPVRYEQEVPAASTQELEPPAEIESREFSYESIAPSDVEPPFSPPAEEQAVSWHQPGHDHPFEEVSSGETFAAEEPAEEAVAEFEYEEASYGEIPMPSMTEPIPTVSEAPAAPVSHEAATAIFDRTENQPVAEDHGIEEYKPYADYSSGVSNGRSARPAIEAAAPARAEHAPRPRFGDRSVDLPIEVPEDERRLHNDARRFARLLVSEIKLYNEQKVAEGRQSNDLYDRLKEAIDRSREMYDKRVQPPVASKFDYFHYELVTSLAEGDVARLGEGYPGEYLQ